MNHLNFIGLTILLFSLEISAKGLTNFVWKSHPEKKYSGDCFEVDAETGGEKYFDRTDEENCRPKDKNELYFLWEQNQEKADGYCFLIDKPTAGKSFAKSAEWKECLPEKIEKILLEGKCYFKGETDLGGVFLKRVSKEDCKPEELTYQFVPSTDGLSGKCVGVNTQTGDTFQENLKKCKPEKTAYMPLQREGYTECYEVAEEGGPAVFIRSVSRKNCRPDNLMITWVQTGNFTGKCLRVSPDRSFQEPLEVIECLDLYETSFSFLPLDEKRGYCLIMDKETSGGRLRQKTRVEDCKPENVSYRIALNGEVQICIEYDSQNPERGYRKEVGLSKCSTGKKDYRWLPNEKNPFLGTCLHTVVTGGVERDKDVEDIHCRPPKVKYVFHVSDPEKEPLRGKCYAVHPDEGPKYFSTQVGKKNCKPKDVVLKYFHPKQFKGGGCYLVDKETLGGKYHASESEEKCKLKFLNLPSQK